VEPPAALAASSTPGTDPGSTRPANEHGTGLIGSLAGFAAFIVLVLLAGQVLFDLYARSAVTAAAFDAARRVAGFDIATLPPDQLSQAEADAVTQARATLGRYGAAATFTWTLTPTTVALRVQMTNPSLVPAGFGHPLGIDTIDRSVRVQAERLVCPVGDPCVVSTGPSP
jgi:hypothetical protein